MDNDGSRIVVFEYDKVWKGKTVIVLPSNIEMSSYRTQLVTEAMRNPSALDYVQTLRVVFYPALAACSTGDVPSEAEFLKMDERDVDAWYVAVDEVNPHWFGYEKKSEAESEAKKKRKRSSKKGVKKQV